MEKTELKMEKVNRSSFLERDARTETSSKRRQATKETNAREFSIPMNGATTDEIGSASTRRWKRFKLRSSVIWSESKEDADTIIMVDEKSEIKGKMIDKSEEASEMIARSKIGSFTTFL